MTFYAHSHPEYPDDPDKWEPLFTPFGEKSNQCRGRDCPACRSLDPQHGHLNKVAWWTAEFAAAMYSPDPLSEAAWQWGYLAGLWHDLGKFPVEWQRYLKSKVDIHSDESAGRMDHSTAGAIHAASRSDYGPLLAYIIAGHHAGLSDGIPLRERLAQSGLLARAMAAAEGAGLPLHQEMPAPPLPRVTDRREGAFAIAAWTRFLFSCLVDADFLATESFMNRGQSEQRPRWEADLLIRMDEVLDHHLREKEEQAVDSPINQRRRQIRESCQAKAELPAGFFSLTVPTGGGKTLASLSFALKHAIRHGLRRVIYVIPFTSIIEQNAREFREVFRDLSSLVAGDIVIEHHSNLDPAQETTANRLGAENWDAPLIVTTSVQFFESLLASRTSRCRKLHRLARSVIILDEAQALPVSLLSPCLALLKTLGRDFGSSVMLCTATQPALGVRENFPIGIDREQVREIVPDPHELFQAFKQRTEVSFLGTLDDSRLVDHFRQQSTPSALFIVNLRRHASALFEQLKHLPGAYHLSAQMCPMHRDRVLKEIRDRLTIGLPVVLVSTRVIEAGVDISFPVVYRAEGGLDSSAQAIGRCNRHGELRDSRGNPVKGRVYLFYAADFPIPPILKDMQEAASTAGQLHAKYPEDLLSLEAIEEFFQLYYWQRQSQTNGWDRPPGDHSPILHHFALGQTRQDLFYALRFSSAAQAFRLIDTPMKAVVIPWGEEGEALWKRLTEYETYDRSPLRSDYRMAQRLTVQIPLNTWDQLLADGQLHLFAGEAIPMLVSQSLYDEHLGLKFSPENHTYIA